MQCTAHDNRIDSCCQTATWRIIVELESVAKAQRLTRVLDYSQRVLAANTRGHDWHVGDIYRRYISDIYPIFSSSKISDIFGIFKIGYFPYFFQHHFTILM